MTTRCPKCGKNNYGDVDKCSFCGAPLKFNPEEEIPEIKEEDIQEKMSEIKVKRIRNPITIAVGGGIMLLGVLLAIIIFFVFMIGVFDSSSVEPEYSGGAYHFKVPGDEEYIFGEITAVVEVSGAESHGFYNHTAYEIDGDTNVRVDWEDSITKDVMRKETDTFVFSERDLGEEGDMVLVKVESKDNFYGEIRAVDAGGYWWGGTGYGGGWILTIPGILVFLGGSVVLTIALIGKKDTSIDRLLEEDAELRKQKLALLQSARAQAMEKRKGSQFHGYKTEAAEGEAPQQPEKETGDVVPQVNTPVSSDQPVSDQTIDPTTQPTTPQQPVSDNQ